MAGLDFRRWLVMVGVDYGMRRYQVAVLERMMAMGEKKDHQGLDLPTVGDVLREYIYGDGDAMLEVKRQINRWIYADGATTTIVRYHTAREHPELIVYVKVRVDEDGDQEKWATYFKNSEHEFIYGDELLRIIKHEQVWTPHQERIDELKALMAKWKAEGPQGAEDANEVEQVMCPDNDCDCTHDISPYDSIGHYETQTTNIYARYEDCKFYAHSPNSYAGNPRGVRLPVSIMAHPAPNMGKSEIERLLPWQDKINDLTRPIYPEFNKEQHVIEAAPGWPCPNHLEPFLNDAARTTCEVCGRGRES